MAQFQAGYFIDGVVKLFDNKTFQKKSKAQMNWLSYYELTTDSNLKHQLNDSIISVFNNILTRGLPTKPTAFIEDFLATTFSKTKKTIDKNNNITYDFFNDEIKENVWRALHIIDNRLPSKYEGNNFLTVETANKEQIKNYFVNKIIPEQFGDYLKQMLVANRQYQSIAHLSPDNPDNLSELTQSEDNKFITNTIDYTVEIPYPNNESKGFAIEFDESQFVDNTDYLLEEKKKIFLSQYQWTEQLRIKKIDFENITDALAPLSYFLFNDYFDQIKKNYESPMYNTPEGLDVMQLTLTPLAVARLQKTLIEFILSGALKLDAEEWKIAVIEQDVPCAFLAIEDFKQQFKRLFLLEGKNRKLPKISLTIYTTKEFEKSELNVLYQGELRLIDKFKKRDKYDLLIDISILRRAGLEKFEYQTSALHIAQIRSSHFKTSTRKIMQSELISYPNKFTNILNKDNDNNDLDTEYEDALIYFLKNIFRKTQFKNGQLQIICKALENKSIIAVQPPASGKTLCYQFAALLQPAIAVVINPIISTAKNQFDLLRSNLIDNCFYINELQYKIFEKNQVKQYLTQGEGQIFHISPVKFYELDFKNIIQESHKNNQFFSYVVIDEADSASPWSHQFVTEYYNLANKALNICTSSTKQAPSLIAITSTVSYNSLADLQNQLNLSKNEIILEKFELPTIKYDVIELQKEEYTSDTDQQKICYNTAIKKINTLQKKILNDYSTNENYCGLIICPEITGKLGVIDNHEKNLFAALNNSVLNERILQFSGTNDDKKTNQSGAESILSLDNLKTFVQSKDKLLISNENIGIGICKPELRQIDFINLPSGTERFFQTMGRLAQTENPVCNLVFDTQKFQNTFATHNFNLELDIETTKTEINLSCGELIQFNKLRKTYRGIQKESSTLHELLTNISFPTEKPAQELQNSVEREFGESFSIWLEPSENPYQLHVSKEGGKKIGYIDLNNKNIVNQASTFEVKIAGRILQFIQFEIFKFNNNPYEFVNFFKTELKNHNIDGIDLLLQKMKTGEQNSITINTSNDKFELLHNGLKKYFTNTNVENIINCYNITNSLNDLLEKLTRYTNINLSKSSILNYEELDKYYRSARNINDTVDCLQKLILLGIIDDYEYINKNKITIRFTKKNEITYLNNLIQYIELFVSKEFTEKIPQIISQITQKSFIQKIALVYIKFYYDFVVKEKFDSLSFIYNIANAYFDEKITKDDFSERMNEFHSLLFTAKYANRLCFPSFEIDTNKGRNEDINLVEKYIDLVGINKEKWQHLKKSCDIVCKKYPNNYVLGIIHSFAIILTQSDEIKQVEIALQKMGDCFNLYRISKNSNLQTFVDKVSYIKQKLFENQTHLKEDLDSYIDLKIHSAWLKSFKTKFLEGFTSSK